MFGTVPGRGIPDVSERHYASAVGGPLVMEIAAFPSTERRCSLVPGFFPGHGPTFALNPFGLDEYHSIDGWYRRDE